MGVVLLGYTVLGLTGFGSALVIVPLLAWQWPLPEVVAMTLLMDVPASAFHSGLNWRQVQWRELRRLLPGLVAGTVITVVGIAGDGPEGPVDLRADLVIDGAGKGGSIKAITDRVSPRVFRVVALPALAVCEALPTTVAAGLPLVPIQAVR